MSLENTPAARISALAAAQKTYFRSGATLSEAFRRTMLRRLDAALANWEKRLCDALWTDLHKSPEEAYLTEISIVRGEIRSHLRHLGRWMRPAPRPTPLKLLPAKSRIVSQPLGQALIVAPWNYPVQLLLNPLVGAISAGCTALLKPSPYTPNVAEALEGMIAEIFDEEYVAVAQGGREVNTLLFGMRWDVIFFTGSPALGRIVMTAAARNLTPVVLELGGKSPSIVDRGADIEVAARRIAWGKTLNAGQTCIAPDYLLIHRSLQDEFSRAFARALHRLHGDDAQQSLHYGRLVNDRAFERVTSYLAQGKILVGGRTDPSDRYIEPTLLAEVDPGAPVMQEEIFGPVITIYVYDDNKYEETLELCDRTSPYGLTGSIFARDRYAIDMAFNKLRYAAGNFYINDKPTGAVIAQQPFGGSRASGTNDKAGGPLNLIRWTNARCIKEALVPPTSYGYPFLGEK
jgi:aldehyde dehydrogenase (NAD+)